MSQVLYADKGPPPVRAIAVPVGKESVVRLEKRAKLPPGTTTVVELNLDINLPKGFGLLCLGSTELAQNGVLIEDTLIKARPEGTAKLVVTNYTNQEQILGGKQKIARLRLIPLTDILVQEDLRRGRGGTSTKKGEIN